MKVDSITIENGKVYIETPFTADVNTLTWNKVPEALFINGNEVKFTVSGSKTVIG